MSTERSRQAAGQRTGGQFKAEQHTEGEIELGGTDTSCEEYRSGFLDRSREVLYIRGAHAKSIDGSHLSDLDETPPAFMAGLKVIGSFNSAGDSRLWVHGPGLEPLANVKYVDMGDWTENQTEVDAEKIAAQYGHHPTEEEVEQIEQWLSSAGDRFREATEYGQLEVSDYNLTSVAALAAGTDYEPHPRTHGRILSEEIERALPSYLKNSDGSPQEREESASAAITDLMHWANSQGLDFSEILHMGMEGYAADRTEDSDYLAGQMAESGLNPQKDRDSKVFADLKAVSPEFMFDPKFTPDEKKYGTYSVSVPGPGVDGKKEIRLRSDAQEPFSQIEFENDGWQRLTPQNLQLNLAGLPPVEEDE